MKITICGSIGFYKEMESARDELVKNGHEVKIPELALEVPQEFGGGKKVYFGQFIEQNGGIDAFPAGHKIWDLKESAINDHYENIVWCERRRSFHKTGKGFFGKRKKDTRVV